VPLAGLHLVLQLTYPSLQFLELLLPTLHGHVFGLVLLHPLQVSVGVHLLLHPQRVGPAACLGVQGGLNALRRPLAVRPQLVELLVLLRHLPVRLGLHLVQLHLPAQDLGLLLLQGGL
uniref:Uncharacterized protein n=1 Tax=Cyclopterus lumpus TaxID=8103 RepID=A0A8C2WYK0_CYCLU